MPNLLPRHGTLALPLKPRGIGQCILKLSRFYGLGVPLENMHILLHR